MIGGGAGAGEDLHRPRARAAGRRLAGRPSKLARLVGRRAEQTEKICLLQQPGATATQQQPAGRHQPHRQAVEIEVFSRALFHFAAGADQLGRIEHHDVVLPALAEHLAHVGEGVGLDEAHAHLVEVGVLAGQPQRLFVEVDAGHLGGVAETLGLHGEPARVAAQVQHAAACAELGQPAAVLPLVAEEARLVPAGKADAEPRAELRGS